MSVIYQPINEKCNVLSAENVNGCSARVNDHYWHLTRGVLLNPVWLSIPADIRRIAIIHLVASDDSAVAVALWLAKKRRRSNIASASIVFVQKIGDIRPADRLG